MASASAFERVAALLPATIAATLGIPEAWVYPGRREQAVRVPVDVVLIDGGWADASRGGTHGRSEQSVAIVVRWRSLPEANRTGATQASTLSRALALLVARFRGQRPWPVELPDMITTRASVIATDSDPGNVGVAQGSVRLGVFFKGDGVGEFGAGATPAGGAA